MEFQSRMEEELRCPRCGQLYVDAVLLSCSHSICFQCAVHLARDCAAPAFAKPPSAKQSRPDSLTVLFNLFPVKRISVSGSRPDSLTVPAAAASEVVGGGGCTSKADSDRSSVGSETDSGVICTAGAGATTPSVTANSRPNSLVGVEPTGNVYATDSHDITYSSVQISCPRCQRTTVVEDCTTAGITSSLPRNRCLETVVDRYRESRGVAILCQRCGDRDGDDEDGAEVAICSGGKAPAFGLCESCLVFLCESCAQGGRQGPRCSSRDCPGQERCGHVPDCVSKECPRGPGLASLEFLRQEEGIQRPGHSSRDCPGQGLMTPVTTAKSWLTAIGRSTATSCSDHPDETLSLFCMECLMAVCSVCVDVDGLHSSHHTKPVGSASRSHKVGVSCC